MKALLRVSYWLVLGVCAVRPALSVPLGTGFTYQGQLNQNGNPVNGTAHLRFSLWNAPGTGVPPTGGTQIGASQLVANIPVANGVFAVLLNSASEFGTSAFNGEARWIQIEVCTDVTCSASTTLGPRQAISATPYALQTRGIFVDASNNVGIGTTTPSSALDIAGSQDALKITGYQSLMTLRDSNDGNARVVMQNVSGGPNFLTESYLSGLNPSAFLRLSRDGLMGLGTATPAAKLDVRGDIKLGSTGQYDAPASPEKLLMIRGSINANGTPFNGCCYTVSQPFTGTYDITFTPQGFWDIPSVTATARSLSVIASTVIISASSVRINLNFNGSGANAPFDFIAIGRR